jgi:carbohydrate-selective porin OprB
VSDEQQRRLRRWLGAALCVGVIQSHWAFGADSVSSPDSPAVAGTPVYAVQAGTGGPAGGTGGTGGTGAGGAGAGGAAGGQAGPGAPAQTPAAPQPEAGPQPAPEVTAPAPSYGPLEGYFEAKKRLEEATGTIPRLNVDLTSQSVVSGPDEFTAWVWRYDFGILQKLWKGAQVDFDLRGGEGPDAAAALGSTMNTNQYAGTPSTFWILHLWLEQKLWDDQFTFRGGKIDIGDWIDVNRFGYYNLLGFSQNHNASIPFPNNPLGAMITIEPRDTFWYVSVGASNAAQNPLETGFDDLFGGGNTDLFGITELGLKLNFRDQPGIYRFLAWYDTRDLVPFGAAAGVTEDDRYGLALSWDQNLTRDVGLFARYGYADTDAFNMRHYWQAGFDWKGIVPGRPKDDLAIGLVQNILVNARTAAVVPGASDSETYLEAYYNLVVYDWIQIQPVLQVLVDPGGVDQDEAWILSVHMAFRF